MSEDERVALVTGVSRDVGIGRAVARRLDADGFRVATAGWRPYDDRMPWGADEPSSDDADDPGRAVVGYPTDLEDPTAADSLLDLVTDQVGPVSVLVLCHCESVDSDIRTTTVESFDRHMAVNARATWQLIKAFAERFPQPDTGGGAGEGNDGRGKVEGHGEGPTARGRIISITSDHTAHNLAYGASKGAMDRIVLAAAVELADLGVTANVINPGATDTGWMSSDIERAVRDRNLQPRVGLPTDTANLVGFLCSPEGGWINGQLLYSDGGLRPG